MKLSSLTSATALAMACTTTSYWNSPLEKIMWDSHSGVAASKESYAALAPLVRQSDADAKAVKSYFCNGKRQTRKLALTVQTLTPQLPTGTALDSAQSYQSEFRKQVDARIQELFYKASYPGSKYREATGFYIANLPQDSLNEFSKVPAELGMDDVAIAYNVADGKFYAFYSRLIDKFSKRGGIKRFQESQLIEAALLVNKFSFLMPQDKSAQVLAAVDAGDSLALPKQLSISDVIANRRKIWQRYSRANTSVKQAPTKDGRETLYQISLDLNPFCEFGRSIEDLTAKSNTGG